MLPLQRHARTHARTGFDFLQFVGQLSEWWRRRQRPSLLLVAFVTAADSAKVSANGARADIVSLPAVALDGVVPGDL